MQSNKGFTLVEMIFVLFVITLLTMLSFTFSRTSVRKPQVKEIYHEISSIIEEARSVALSTRSRVDLQITEYTIGYQSSQQSRSITLPKGVFFILSKTIYFNKKGTVNQGNRIALQVDNQQYNIIFNVGSGNFYLQS